MAFQVHLEEGASCPGAQGLPQGRQEGVVDLGAVHRRHIAQQ